MTNLEMFYFAGKCLSMDEQTGFREEIIQKIDDDDIDWAHFVHLCSNHLILPVIYLKFKAHKLIEHLPGELAEFLKEIYDLNLARNEQILLQINDIVKLLNANDIYPTFLKGTGNLLDGLYSDKGERMIGDIDFLVPEKDYLKTARLLEDDGYYIDSEFYGNILIEIHYPILFKPDVPAMVEVHRLIVPKKYGKKFEKGAIEKKVETLGDAGFYSVLVDHDNITLNFIHSQLSHKGDLNGIVSFRDIYDLYLILKRVGMPLSLNEIPFKGKAITYLVFAGKALGLPLRFYQNETCAAKIFEIKHSLNYNSPVFYKTYNTFVFLCDKIFRGYLGRGLKSLYSQNERRIIIDCLCNRQWYSYHFKIYKTFFKPVK
ncbi:MAG: nucleotidyltransferase family protein [Mariniphaga sp.]